MSTMETITASQLRNFFRMGEAVLNQNKEEINALNVFPVPDGDTGTNMGLTLRSAVKNLEEGMSIKEICSAVSRGALMGARGNSGVITSQILRGITMSFQNAEKMDAPALADAFEKGVEIAYKSVLKPVEGTILTVSRMTAEAAREAVNAGETDIVAVLENAIVQGRVALNNTPNQLPVLKEAGVVDAGGRGFLFMIEGGLLGLQGKGIESIPILEATTMPDKTAAFSADLQEMDITYKYCTELMIHNAKKDHEFVRKELEKRDGDSLVCVGDEGIIKIHFHTNDPGKIISFALTIGELFDIKIENMKEQMAREAAEKRSIEETKVQGVKKKCGIVAVCAGDGMAEIFKSLGVDEVISGGQTMNPSAEDIMMAMAKVNADEIIILPNNGNIILAAQQAVSMSDTPVAVVPTKFVTQGVSVLLNYNAEASAEENAEEMTDAIEAVQNGEITFAVRDTKYNGISIKADDMLGLLDGEIVCSCKTLEDAMMTLVEKTDKEDAALLTLYYGEAISEEEANQMAEALGAKYEELDIEVYEGGQPLYYYLVSLE